MPAKVREKLGLKPGTPVVFELREGAAVLKKVLRTDVLLTRDRGFYGEIFDGLTVIEP